MLKSKNKVSRKNQLLSHLGKVAMGIASAGFVLAPSSASAIDAADAVGSEGGKKVVNEAFKIARSKPVLSINTGIICIACIIVAGV
jgi:hypothetical protein